MPHSAILQNKFKPNHHWYILPHSNQLGPWHQNLDGNNAFCHLRTAAIACILQHKVALLWRGIGRPVKQRCCNETAMGHDSPNISWAIVDFQVWSSLPTRSSFNPSYLSGFPSSDNVQVVLHQTRTTAASNKEAAEHHQQQQQHNNSRRSSNNNNDDKKQQQRQQKQKQQQEQLDKKWWYTGTLRLAATITATWTRRIWGCLRNDLMGWWEDNSTAPLSLATFRSKTWYSVQSETLRTRRAVQHRPENPTSK